MSQTLEDQINGAAYNVGVQLDNYCALLNSLKYAQERRDAALALLQQLQEWDDQLESALAPYYNETILVWPSWTTIPSLVTITPALLAQNRFTNSGLALDLQDVAETGGFVQRFDVLPWIAVFFLAVLTALALSAGAPVLALLLGFGTAVVAMIAALQGAIDTGGDTVGNTVTTGLFSLPGLALVALAGYYLYTRTRIFK